MIDAGAPLDEYDDYTFSIIAKMPIDDIKIIESIFPKADKNKLAKLFKRLKEYEL